MTGTQTDPGAGAFAPLAIGLRERRSRAMSSLLCAIGLAIDRRTVEKGRIGVVLDAAIALEQAELADLGFTRGRKRDGYKGAYYELAA